MALLELFKKLGLPTENENGHALGCSCSDCAERREKRFQELRSRVQAGEKPETLFELLATRKRKHEEH